MGSCFKSKVIKYARDQVGNECGKTNQYSAEMDAIHFYNTLKNGEADSCSIFVDNSVLHGCVDPSYDEDPEGAKWTALYMLNEPQSAGANEGAGCAQAVSYFQNMDAWYTETSDYATGDKYFLRRDSAVSGRNPLGVYHTGIIVDWGYIESEGKEGFLCVEGNTNGGMVAYKFYSYADADRRWAGAGRPRYDSEDEVTPDDPSDDVKPEPTPDPEPEKPSEPIGKYEVVNVSSFLNVREGAGREYKSIWKLYEGDIVDIYEIENGWGQIQGGGWVSMDYLKAL